MGMPDFLPGNNEGSGPVQAVASLPSARRGGVAGGSIASVFKDGTGDSGSTDRGTGAFLARAPDSTRVDGPSMEARQATGKGLSAADTRRVAAAAAAAAAALVAASRT